MLVAIDFETDPILPRPDYPPYPRGCAVMVDGEPGFYYAWGHPIENNVDKAAGYREVAQYFEDPDYEIVMHNAAFDCAVAEKHLSVTIPWDRIHDTMLLAFIANPFGELALKPCAERVFNMPPDEQDAVRDWLVSHGICRANDKQWGAHICKAPGNVVRPYAIGDVERTLKLFHHFMNGGASPFIPTTLKSKFIDRKPVRLNGGRNAPAR